MKELGITAGKQYLGTKGRQYITVRPLDEGGQGVVWIAKDQSTNEEVVLKFPHKTTKERDNIIYKKSIRREIDLLKKIWASDRQVNPPPSIIRFIDESYDKEDLFLVEEYLEGKTLWDTVLDSDNGRGRDRCLPEKVAAEYAKQIGEGLHHLHAKAVREKPIIHRDLKAPNVLVTKRGCVIIDLGVGKEYENAEPSPTSTVQKRRPSTVQRIQRDLNFHCPIHYEGDAWNVMGPCDIYAAARITFFMLTGDTEIQEYEDQKGNMTKKVNELVPSVSEEFSDLIQSALDPEHRYIQIAKDESGNARGWVNKIDEVISHLSSPITPHVYSPREAVSKKPSPADLQPHIICMGQRWDIENGLCEIGREHNCPDDKNPPTLYTQKSGKSFYSLPNHNGCARDVIVKGIDADGFSYPHPLSATGMISPDVAIKNPQIEYHHLRIWKDEGKFWVKDLSSRNKSARIVNGRWQTLKPGKKQALKNIERLAVGFTEKGGPVIPLSFYKE